MTCQWYHVIWHLCLDLQLDPLNALIHRRSSFNFPTNEKRVAIHSLCDPVFLNATDFFIGQSGDWLLILAQGFDHVLDRPVPVPVPTDPASSNECNKDTISITSLEARLLCVSLVMLLMERNDWQTCTLQVIQPVEVRAWDRPGVNWRSPVRLIPQLSCMYFSILWISLVFLASALTQSFLLSRRTVRKYLRCCDHRDNSTTFRMQMHGIYLFLQSDILIFFGCTGYFYVNVRHR